MSKILSKLFPLFDHLYIYQILEYDSGEYIRWFFKNLTKRDLQKKHQLEWTKKALALFFASNALIIFASVYIAANIYPLLLLLYLIFFLLLTVSPIFLVISQILISPLEVYQKLKILDAAKEKLSKLPDLKVVAITGSFGKTSTKDILYTLLFKKYYVVKTPKSFNTPLGIAQTVLEIVKENTNIFICEIGAYKRGEIKNLTKLLNPTIGIITAIAPQHLEKFGSLENIAKAKIELAESLPKDGIAILNGESDWLKSLALHLEGVNVNFYGSGSRYFASDIKIATDDTSFLLHTPRATTQISISLIGEHHIQNFLAASAAALNLGLTLPEIKERARLLLPTPHRLEIKKIGNMILIDNSYNTNPKSAEASLNLLASFKGSRKIVITPGFVELGKEAGEANRKFGEEIVCLADEVIIVGENAKKDLLTGIKKVCPDPEESAHFVNSTQEAIQLAQQLTMGVETIVLLENDLPDQYF